MTKLVEVYIANDYAGVHTLETAKEHMWINRAYCHLDRNVTEKQFKDEQNLNLFNSWMTTGKVKLIAEV